MARNVTADLMDEVMRRFGVSLDYSVQYNQIEMTTFGSSSREFYRGLPTCDVRIRCSPEKLDAMLQAMVGNSVRVAVVPPFGGPAACVYCGSDVTPGDACEACGARKSAKVGVLTRQPRMINGVPEADQG